MKKQLRLKLILNKTKQNNSALKEDMKCQTLTSIGGCSELILCDKLQMPVEVKNWVVITLGTSIVEEDVVSSRKLNYGMCTL